MPRKYGPKDVMPERVATALGRDPFWFVIGGHAVRCFCPYRPSNDVDLGVGTAKDLDGLLRELGRRGKTSILERARGTVHLRFDGVDVSIFVLPSIRAHTDDNALTLDGILATKLHAILDRGLRRDFFDLYVMLQQERVALVDCLRALRTVYAVEINEGLLLRALTFFDDADAEAPLPGEGMRDWEQVKAFFIAAAGALIVPPTAVLDVQRRIVDVRRPRTKPKPKRRHSK